MANATLTDGPAVQLTFPWALPKAEDESTIVAERGRQTAAAGRGCEIRQPSPRLVARVSIERHRSAAPMAKARPSVIQPTVPAQSKVDSATAAVAAIPTAECDASLQESLCGDRIGKPFRIGAVMFRLLKRYGITDEEIAEGIATYNAKRGCAPA